MGVILFPHFEKYPVFKGLFVGGCVERGDGSSFRAMAHAHMTPSDKWYGWICVRSHRRVFMADGRPSLLMLHELAHLLVNPPDVKRVHWHDDAWRKTLREIGGRVERHYTKAYHVARGYGQRRKK